MGLLLLQLYFLSIFNYVGKRATVMNYLELIPSLPMEITLA